MRMNNYLSVLMVQLKMNLDCNSKDEYLIESDSILEQLNNAFCVLKEKQPDITLFPEMSYIRKLDNKYKKFSKEGRIVVAGSYYNNGINMTVVFQDGKKHEFQKLYASGAEPMARRTSIDLPSISAFNIEKEDDETSYEASRKIFQEEIEKHKFFVKGKKIYIFNCMEYYHLAYYIARDIKYNDSLFGIFTICSNSNTHVFEEETIVIHNHNEALYTFMLNCVSTYKSEDYGDGQSYIYGPISGHEKEWLVKDGIDSKKNPNHILSLSKTEAQYAYGKFIATENLSRFGRSDKYINNPKEITIGNLITK